MDRKKIHTLVRLALLVGLEVVLSRFFSLATPHVKIGFAFVPLALAGMLYGPVAGGVVGGLADLLGAVLFPIGPYFPGFTATNVLKGMVFGWCLREGKGGRWGAVSVAVCVSGVVLSLGLNTLWISLLYGTPFLTLLPARAVQELLLIPLQIVVLRLIGAPKVQHALAFPH